MKREDVKNKIPGITEEQLNWIMQPAAMAAPDICVGNMAPFAGIEPAASGFGDRRSANMS